ncbi:hypothetical protein [Salinibacter phage 4_17]
MPYQEYALRAPSVQAAIDSAKPALQDAGLDPYDLDVLSQTEDGDTLGRVVDVVEPGRWYITDPTLDEDGNQTDPGVKGDYALINVRTRQPELQQFIEQFSAEDPATQPKDVPDSETIGKGLHRIDETQISSPERVWATV